MLKRAKVSKHYETTVLTEAVLHININIFSTKLKVRNAHLPQLSPLKTSDFSGEIFKGFKVL
jgi:hypothetical protein